MNPSMFSTSIMVVAQMVQNDYEPGKGLGLLLQIIVNPINPMGNKETFRLVLIQLDVIENVQKIKKEMLGI